MADFYPYKTNPDGSKTSICMRCYRTIGADGKGDLAKSERDHTCHPEDLRPAGQTTTPEAGHVVEIDMAKEKTTAKNC